MRGVSRQVDEVAWRSCAGGLSGLLRRNRSSRIHPISILTHPSSVNKQAVYNQIHQLGGRAPLMSQYESMRRALKRLGINGKRAKHWITSVRRVGAYEISVKHGRGRE